MTLKTWTISAIFACAALTGMAPRARATVALAPQQVFVFTGTCAVGDCTGTARGVLTFDEFASNGSFDLSSSRFVSFDYRSSVESFSITSPQYFTGMLSTTPGAYMVNIGDGVNFLNTYSSGLWCANCSFDTGPTHLWISGAPEPSSWALMIVGVGMVGATLRRKAYGAASAVVA